MITKMTAEYLLDANSISDMINHPRGRVATRTRQIGQNRVAASIIAAAEVRFGYHRKSNPRLTIAAELVLDSLAVLPLEPPVDWRYAEVRTSLERTGTPIGGNDMWIAAHALALDCTLITANEREFRRVRGLRVENWLTSAGT